MRDQRGEVGAQLRHQAGEPSPAVRPSARSREVNPGAAGTVKEVHPAISPFHPRPSGEYSDASCGSVRLQVLGVALALAASVAPVAPPAPASATPLRVAAPFDCGHNTFCALGLRRYYGIDIAPQLRPMAAGATLQALQQGRAGVAVVFSTDPSLTNPDIVELAGRPRHVRHGVAVPAGDARASSTPTASALRTRITTIGKRLSTAELRRMNGEVAGGMRPRDVAAGFVRRARLGGSRALRQGPRLAVGAQDFVESRLVALVYAQALRGGGFNASVADVGGFRDRAYDALYRNRVQLLVDYGSSALDHVAGFPGFSSNDAGRVRTLLTGWMRRYRITVFPSTGAGSRNRFVDAASDRGRPRAAAPQRPGGPRLPPRAGAGPRAGGGGRGTRRPAAVHPPRRLARPGRARHPGAPRRPRLLRHAVPQQRVRRDDAPRGRGLPGGLPAGARTAPWAARRSTPSRARRPARSGRRRPRGPAIPARSRRRRRAGCCT